MQASDDDAGHELIRVNVPFDVDCCCCFFFINGLGRQWYRVDAASLDEATASRFVQLAADDDADTLAFLDGCQEQSNAVFTQMWHLLARTFLSFFVTQTSINGSDLSF